MAIARNEGIPYESHLGEKICQKWVMDVLAELANADILPDGYVNGNILVLRDILRWDESSGEYNNEEFPEYTGSEDGAEGANNES